MVEQITKQRCAIYTRKSSEEGLDQEFNSLHAQREACESYIHSQKHEGWRLIKTNYDDGGFSGGNIERPGLQQLKQDVAEGLIDVVLVYKVDRLSRSLADFVKLIELFDQHGVAFAAVTQQFNTSTSMGRLTLNVLLSFAQFEREVTGERIRDKIAASKQKGMWMGGRVPLGYDVVERKLIANQEEADVVRHIYHRYIGLKNVKTLKAELDQQGFTTKARGGTAMIKFSRGALYNLLKNPIYIGKIAHKGQCYPGQHNAILDLALWEEVQQLLRHNAQTNRVRGVHTSLLAGVLFDDAGNPMSPTHSKKGSKRYRYYISQAILQFREDEAGSVQRVPAQSIEDCVSEQIIGLMRDKPRLLDFLKLEEVDAPVFSAAILTGLQLASKWESSTQREKKTWIKRWVERIELSRSRLRILISVDSLRKAILKKPFEKTYCVEVIEVDVALKRCGLEARLIVEGVETKASTDSILSLQQALLCGLKWNHALRTGRYGSFQEIAINENVTRGYVRRLSKLAYLSPELMDAIAAGNVPQSLTLEKLKGGIPLDWSEQKRVFS